MPRTGVDLPLRPAASWSEVMRSTLHLGEATNMGPGVLFGILLAVVRTGKEQFIVVDEAAMCKPHMCRGRGRQFGPLHFGEDKHKSLALDSRLEP